MELSEMKLLFNRDQIAEAVARLGAEISRDYRGGEVVLIGVLKGSIFFLADLAREISVPTVIDFVRVASYGSETVSSGVVELRKGLEMRLRGRDVIIVEDIVDSGHSLSFLYNKFLLDEPRSLRICTLLDKRSRRRVDIEADYAGLTIEDGFVVGYGLDYDERYRNLPEIYTAEPAE